MKKQTFGSILFGLLFTISLGIGNIAQADLIRNTTDCPDDLIVCNTTIATPGDLITQVISIVLGVAGSISVLFVILGGFRYVTAQGDEKKVDAAKSTLKNAIIGMVVILLAYAILQAVEQFVISSVA